MILILPEPYIMNSVELVLTKTNHLVFSQNNLNAMCNKKNGHSYNLYDSFKVAFAFKIKLTSLFKTLDYLFVISYKQLLSSNRFILF